MIKNNNMKFTEMLGNVVSELDTDFKFFHTREEAEILLRTITEQVNDNYKCITQYGTKKDMISADIVEKDARLRQVFTEAANDFGNSNEKEKEKAINEKLKELPAKIRNLNTLSSFNEYKGNCKNIIDLLISVNDMDSVFLSKLDKRLDEFASSRDYLRRLVIRRLYDISPEFVCEKNNTGGLVTDEEGKNIEIAQDKLPSTRLLIMKQFIKQFNWCEKVGTAGGAKDSPEKRFECTIIRLICENAYSGDYQKMANELNEDFFDLLKMGSKESDKAEAYRIEKLGDSFDNIISGIKSTALNNVKIIKVADTLAQALFDDSGNTPLKLYIFAIAFQMEAWFPFMPEAGSENRFRDIRKNLFYDYYCENLANYLLGGHDRAQVNITGYGINVKNFAEIIFIYFLRQNDKTALEKLQKATKMIEDCCEHYRSVPREQDTSDNDTDDGQTEDNKKPEKDSDFVVELIKDFDKLDECGDSDGYGFNFINSEKLGASEALKKLLECNEEQFKQIIFKKWDMMYSASAFNGMSNYHTTAAENYSTLENNIHNMPEVVRRVEITVPENTGNPRIKNLVNRFNALSKREKNLRKWYEQDAEDNECPQDIIDRCTLLFALSDNTVLNIMKVNSVKRSTVLANYHSFYQHFCSENNPILLACGFQEIISKNIFDLLVVYLTYKKCNINMKGNDKNT